MTDAAAIDDRLLRGSTLPDLLGSVQMGLRIGRHVVRDRLSPPRLDDERAVPAAPTALTSQWLTSVLCANRTNVTVREARLVSASDGTSVRASFALDYEGPHSGLPDRIFVKSAGSFGTRITAGISGAMINETLFYRLVRPLVRIEAPMGYHAAYDEQSFRSVLIIEDLVETKQARFPSARAPFTRAMAENVATLLGTLHGSFDQSGLLDKRLAPLQSYEQFISAGILRAGLKRFHFKGFEAAAPLFPQALQSRRDESWSLIVESILAHRTLPHTVIHGDTHPGNWYQTGDGAMGLLDWQCTAKGHGARDLAYALSTQLAIQDRRAWERDLLELYRDAFAAAGGTVMSFDHLFRLYRQQIWGALLMWTPTYRPPPFFPAMQPEDISRLTLERIGAALDDLDCHTAFQTTI